MYDDRWGASRRVVQLRHHLWRELAPRVEGRVLEIGPGLRPTAPVRRSFFVDTSEGAAAGLGRAGGRSLRGGDGALPFRDGMFQAALALEVLEHVEEDRRLLAEVARVLRPGGVAVVSVPLYMSRWSATDEACAHVRRYEPEELFAKLRQAGLVPQRFHTRRGGSHPGLARMGSAVLGAMPRLSNWWLQNVVFTVQGAWHRSVARLRWIDPDEPVSPDAAGVTVVATKGT